MPKYSIISTYEEYKDYTDFIGGNRLWTNIASYNATRYNEAYFEDNVLILVVVDGTENPYNADVISTITDDGEIILDIDRYHNVRNNGRIWNIFVPLPGTNWIADNVTINYTDSYPE